MELNTDRRKARQPPSNVASAVTLCIGKNIKRAAIKTPANKDLKGPTLCFFDSLLLLIATENTAAKNMQLIESVKQLNHICMLPPS
jgi:hypothetical protein